MKFSGTTKAADGIARHEGRSPDQREGSSRSRGRAALAEWRKLESSRRLAGASAGRIWRLAKDGKPSGVVRGECRGGLGGAAAPNRPPRRPPRRRPKLNIKNSPRARRATKTPPKRTSFFPYPRRAGAYPRRAGVYPRRAGAYPPPQRRPCALRCNSSRAAAPPHPAPVPRPQQAAPKNLLRLRPGGQARAVAACLAPKTAGRPRLAVKTH